MNGTELSVYVVSHGQFIRLVTADLEKAEEHCRTEGGQYMNADGHRFDPDDFPGRTIHRYRSARSGRWNKSGYTITTTTMES